MSSIFQATGIIPILLTISLSSATAESVQNESPVTQLTNERQHLLLQRVDTSKPDTSAYSGFRYSDIAAENGLARADLITRERATKRGDCDTVAKIETRGFVAQKPELAALLKDRERSKTFRTEVIERTTPAFLRCAARRNLLDAHLRAKNAAPLDITSSDPVAIWTASQHASPTNKRDEGLRLLAILAFCGDVREAIADLLKIDDRGAWLTLAQSERAYLLDRARKKTIFIPYAAQARLLARTGGAKAMLPAHWREVCTSSDAEALRLRENVRRDQLALPPTDDGTWPWDWNWKIGER